MKKIIPIAIVGLIVLCGLKAVALQSNQAETTIQSGVCHMKFNTNGMLANTTNLTLNITGGIGVTTRTKNVGEFDATNVTVQMTITGGILNLINMTRNGPYVAPLPPDETLKRGALPIGLGPITINMTVSADNAAPVTKTAKGIIVLFFVILK